MPADIVLKNANVLTMDARQPSAELVAITGDRISMVAAISELASVTGAKTRVIDCQGKTVVPGFNDAHLHLFSFIRKLLSIDLSPSSVSSIADIKSAIRRKTNNTPPGQWLSGTDYNEFYLAEKRCPTRWDIDEVAPDHPVVLSHRSLHACVLNTLALARAGIDKYTEEPPGARIERDLATGEPNGILINMLGHIRSQVMPPFTEVELDEALTLANEQLLSCGITSIQDATYKNDLDRWQAVRRHIESGRLRPRVVMMAGPETRFGFQQIGLTTGSGDYHLRLGAVKFLLEAHPNQNELNAMALDCHHAGWQLAFHAVAKSTVEAAVAALEHINNESSTRGRRHRIEHCAECPPRLLERLYKLGVVIVTQPSTLYYSGERYLATVTTRQLPWLYRIKAPLDRGIIVAGSSDTPVTPVNPLVGVYAAVTRKAASGQKLLPEESISASQALAMYTVNAAHASFEEDSKGSITPGKLADIAVLSDNPLKVPPEQIKDVRVAMTIIGGKVVWES
jgi:predicted amidohydrolase YtcJ